MFYCSHHPFRVYLSSQIRLSIKVFNLITIKVRCLNLVQIKKSVCNKIKTGFIEFIHNACMKYHKKHCPIKPKDMAISDILYTEGFKEFESDLAFFKITDVFIAGL